MLEKLKIKGVAHFYSVCTVLIIVVLQTFAIDVYSNNRKFEKVEIYQNGIEIVGKDNVFYLDTAAFSLRFYNKTYDVINKKFYATRLAAFYAKEQIPDIKTGVSISSVPCFKPGTGIAASREEGYTALVFNSKAHHYLFYQDEKNKRVNKIGEKRAYSLFEFSTDSLSFYGEKESMQKTKVSQFYLLLLTDRNLNGIVDEGEYKLLTIRIANNYQGWDRCYWNITNEKGVTPLLQFLSFNKWSNESKQSRLQILQEALSCKDINLNQTDESGYTPLHYAIYTYYVSKYNRTNYEVKRNSLDIIKQLLQQKKLDLNKRDFGYKETPFFTLVTDKSNSYNNLTIGRFDSIVNLFLQRKDLNLAYRNDINKSVFYYDPDLSDVLLDNSISDTLYNDNASWEMIKIIEQLGYDETLDDSTFFKKNINICFNYNADPNYYYDAYNYTPLIWICSTTNRPYGYSQEEIDTNIQIRDLVLKLFLHNPLIDVNFPDDYGNTPLHIAAKNFNDLLVQTLLQDNHIDCNRVNKNGNTPLMALLESFKYCYFEEHELQCLQAFMAHKVQLDFKVVNFNGKTIVDIINKELLVDFNKDYLMKKHPDIYEEIINLRDYAQSRMNKDLKLKSY